MLRAWQQAGSRLSAEPALAVRWTRICFCGQETEGGRVADRPEVGVPFLTGSEEERGPLFDVTRQHFEGLRSPVALGPHGHKVVPARCERGADRGAAAGVAHRAAGDRLGPR